MACAVISVNLSAQNFCKAGILNGPFTDSSNFYPDVYYGNKITVHKTAVLRYFRAGNLGTGDSIKMALYEYNGGYLGNLVSGSETKAITGDSVRLKTQNRQVVSPGNYYIMGAISGGGMNGDFTRKELTLQPFYGFQYPFDQSWPYLKRLDSSCCYQYNFWVEMQCCPIIDTIEVTACKDYVSPSGKIYTNSGQYYDTISPQPYLNCDSIVLIDLTMERAYPWLYSSDFSLYSVYDAKTYQWIDCSTGLRIPGATDSIYTDSTGGSFAVIMKKNGCTDTSLCYTINGVGMEEHPSQGFKLYPNPTNGVVNIETTSKPVFKVFSPTGQEISVKPIQTASGYRLQLPKEPGLYVLKVTTQNHLNTYSIIRK